MCLQCRVWLLCGSILFPTSLLRSRSGRSHVTLPVPTRLLQTDIHSFLGNKPINVWLSFSRECSRLWLVQRIQWQLNERLIGSSKQKPKTPRKECMSVWSSRVGTGSVTWLRPERLRRRLVPNWIFYTQEPPRLSRVVGYSFSYTIPSIFKWHFTNLSLIWPMRKLCQLLEKDWCFGWMWFSR